MSPSNVIFAVVVTLEEALVLLQMAWRFIPDHWMRRINPAIHQAKVTGQDNVFVPLETDHSSVSSKLY